MLKPYLLCLGVLLASTVEAAYQDAAALLETETASVPRWRASLIASPYGSVHVPQLALPLRETDNLLDRPFGLTTGSLAAPTEILVVTPEGADPATTGSIPPEAAASPFPVAVQETKGDLLMSRAGLADRLRVDPDAGGIVRSPRLVIEPPEEERPLIQSFQKVEPPKHGKQVMVASIEPAVPSDYALAFQPLLASPLDEPWKGRIQFDDFERDRHCLATAVYFEARGESEGGQRAVAQVVLNRVLDSRYPDTVCGVVYQNQRWRNRCQFSFACDGRPERITDKRSWSNAMQIAEEALYGDYFDDGIGEATHYHATYVRPRWSRYLNKVEKVGAHIFYQLKPGQR